MNIHNHILASLFMINLYPLHLSSLILFISFLVPLLLLLLEKNSFMVNHHLNSFLFILMIFPYFFKNQKWVLEYFFYIKNWLFPKRADRVDQIKIYPSPLYNQIKRVANATTLFRYLIGGFFLIFDWLGLEEFCIIIQLHLPMPKLC